jgi:hypothetical protein
MKKITSFVIICVIIAACPKKLGIVSIGSENSYTIKVTPRSYVFLLNGITDSLPRASATVLAKGYKLYPFFGGDEPAPQNIYISIKEL